MSELNDFTQKKVEEIESLLKAKGFSKYVLVLRDPDGDMDIMRFGTDRFWTIGATRSAGGWIGFQQAKENERIWRDERIDDAPES